MFLPLGWAGGGEVLGLIFARYVPLASQSPYPIIVYSVANYRPHLSQCSVQICNFRDANLVTFYLCIYLITFHLLYNHSGMFVNHKYKELSYPKIRKCATPF